MNCQRQYLSVGIQYLTLARHITNEIANHGNRNFVISGSPITDKQIEEETFWTDINFIIPLLFNFYHGIEVILKGFVINQSSIPKNHKLTYLFSIFKKTCLYSNLEPLIGKYINNKNMPPLISSYLNSTQISIDNYYEAWKYPEDRTGNNFQHITLMYKGIDGVQFYEELNDDILAIIRETLNYGKEKI